MAMSFKGTRNKNPFSHKINQNGNETNRIQIFPGKLMRTQTLQETESFIIRKIVVGKATQ